MPSDKKPRHPKLAYLRHMPEDVQALMNKIVPDNSQGKSTPGTQGKSIQINADSFSKLSQSIGQNATDASSVFELLPDVELAEQILVGSILSPKDMVSIELSYTVNRLSYESEVARPLLAVVEKYFNEEFKLTDELGLILEEVLFTKGAYINLILPENNLDQLINGNTNVSVESFTQMIEGYSNNTPLGILGHPTNTKVSLESISRHHRTQMSTVKGPYGRGTLELPGVEVSDNFNKLKQPTYTGLRRKKAMSKAIHGNIVSMESAAKGLTPAQIDQLYAKREKQHAETKVVAPSYMSERPSVGHPLVIKLPIESVIPVFVPGDPSDHVGYFILTGDNGRPISRTVDQDHYGRLRNNFKANTQDNSSEMVRQVRAAMGGASNDNKLDFDQIQQAYNDILENDLVNRLRNGIYGEEYELDISEQVARTMLFRSFKNEGTKLIYVPAELVMYCAFDYNEQGVGDSLLTKSKILSAMRTVLQFSEVMAGVRNSVGRKKVNINIDPDDPDPQKTISDIQTLVLESAHRGFPLGSPDPAQTLDYLNRAGFDFSIDVDSDNFPTTKVSYDDYNTNINAPDNELQERLRRQHISSLGINPELVDPTSSPEFAVSVVNNNLMMTRRVMRYQKKLVMHLTKLVRTFVSHSSKLREALLKELEEHKKELNKEQRKLTPEEIVEQFINAIELSLPAPDVTKLEQQAQAFNQYSDFLERALEAYINQDMFTPEQLAIEPDLQQQTLVAIKSYYQRQWLESNNVMPELSELTEMDGKKPMFSLLDIQSNYFASLGEAIQAYAKEIVKKREAWEKKNNPDDTGGDTDDGFDTDAGGDDTDDGFGGGDFDQSDDLDSEAEEGEDDLPEEAEAGTGDDDSAAPDLDDEDDLK